MQKAVHGSLARHMSVDCCIVKGFVSAAGRKCAVGFFFSGNRRPACLPCHHCLPLGIMPSCYAQSDEGCVNELCETVRLYGCIVSLAGEFGRSGLPT